MTHERETSTATAAESIAPEHSEAIREAEGKLRLVVDCGQSVAIDCLSSLGAPRSDEEWRAIRQTVADGLGIDARNIEQAERKLAPVPGNSVSVGQTDTFELTVKHLRPVNNDGPTYLRYALTPIF